jgi:signal peptidase I
MRDNEQIAGLELEARGRDKVIHGVIELVIAFAVAFVITWLLKSFVIQPFEVPSGSMEPTIMIGDKIISDQLTFRFRDIEKGDIVIFNDKTEPGRILVKRVVAVGGQTVDIVEHRVVVDGVTLYEPYVHGQYTEPFDSANHWAGISPISYPYKVPEGYIWVMGDNRTRSADSRYFGVIDENAVIGRGMMVFWPPGDIGFF